MPPNRRPPIDPEFDEEIDGMNEADPIPHGAPLGGVDNIRGTSIYGDQYGSVGRSSSPPLWDQAAAFPQVAQLRVFRNEQGVKTSVGLIDASATEEDFIRSLPNAMPKPGDGRVLFIFRPLDMHGTHIGSEFSIPISEHHTAIAAQRRTSAGPVGAPAWGGYGFDPGDLMKRTLASADRQAEQAAEIAREERKRFADLQAQTAQERVDLAGAAVNTVQSMSERMLAADHDRQRTFMEQQAQLNGQGQAAQARVYETLSKMQTDQASTLMTILAQQNERAERARQAEMDDLRRRQQEDKEARAKEAERQQDEINRARRRDEDDYKLRLATLKLEADERESERNRRFERERLEMQHSRDRDKEHSERMMQLQIASANSKNGTDFMETVTKIVATAQSLGLDVPELLSRFTGGDSSEGWLALAEKVVGKGGDVVREAIRAKAVVAAKQVEAKGAVATAQAAAKAAPAPVVQRLPWDALADADDDEDEDEDEDDEDEEGDEDEDNEDEDGSRNDGPMPVPTTPLSARAPAASAAVVGGLGLSTERAARGAARELVTEMRSTPASGWSTVLIRVVTGTPSLVQLVERDGLRSVARQAGADDPLIDRIIAALRDNPLTSGFPVGE